ncbi:NAD-dependent epimerase/dehydratase family protein [Paenibacillus lycopersici]|uniref:NAD-dependent epimerase/dehydratase family protein n=1 Tax=Paenibacillus lycopersici TaxID=2704462 RepID=A0A6C0G085_9BACL|nr:NAD-dependent epimerase/dehydratase family protein [Paenibacillus lycopersici]QHT59920.1 NAD-dependent epimerase/dehydratase family protein [Paenibacillus lycopersici]
MKVLVTGGAGFIGSHVVNALIQNDHNVIVVDNLSTGSKEKLHSDVKHYQVDITSEDLFDVVNEERPAAIIHHAAQIDVQLSLKEPVYDARVNILGTLNLLEAARKTGVEKIVYASSAAAYGNPLYLPVDENHPVAPISFYGASKFTPELYFELYSKLYNIRYVILRYANVYGIGQEVKGEGGVVAVFINRFINGETPVIYGDGEQTRDFVYVKDIAEANINALHFGNDVICNISRNEQTSINELINVLGDISGNGLIPRYAKERLGDIKHSRLDNSAALKELNWKPRYNLYNGLEETFTFYNQYKNEVILTRM